MTRLGYAVSCIDPAESDLEQLDWTPFDAAFVALHQARYGFTLDAPVEVVSLRHVAEGAGRSVRFSRDAGRGTRNAKRLRGPASLALSDATLFVAPGWNASQDADGHWMLTRTTR